MIVDQAKLHTLLSHPLRFPDPGELRREGNIFFVGGALSPQETLETLFDSYCQAPADLFHLTFSGEFFHQGEELARLIKKNFNNHLMGQLDDPAQGLIERAYAAGVDILDIPLRLFDADLARERHTDRARRLKALAAAQAVFPRWGVASTLMAGDEPPSATTEGIDALLAVGIVPLVALSPHAARFPAEEIAAVFQHLVNGWHRQRIPLQPLLPLMVGTTPLAAARPKSFLRGFMDRIQDRRLLATSDFRRSLRVRQVEESFGSAGL